MEIRRAWLLVVLPAAGAIVGAAVHVLLTVGEARKLGAPALCGAGVGLAIALLGTVRAKPTGLGRPGSSAPPPTSGAQP